MGKSETGSSRMSILSQQKKVKSSTSEFKMRNSVGVTKKGGALEKEKEIQFLT